METLNSLSPLDGRYAEDVNTLRSFLTEEALIRHRIQVELRYLIALSEAKVCRKLSEDEIALLLRIEEGVGEQQLGRIKEIEGDCKHDVKAIEYWLREEFAQNSLKDLIPFLHLGLTSNDVNDVSYALMLRGAIREVMLSEALELKAVLERWSREHAALPMLARTHGQPASPTTLGKELRAFSDRLSSQMEQLRSYAPSAKLSGATGTYAAQQLVAPEVEWVEFAREFLSSLGLRHTVVATQIDPKDSYAELFDLLRRINTILVSLCQDLWTYIQLGYLRQRSNPEEVGSSTMPHKVNPILFENAEGNLQLANSIFIFLSQKLPISRLQRDLSDSTVMRNLGLAFGHTLLAWKNIVKGLQRCSPAKERIAANLEAHPEVLAEAIQSLMRKHGLPEAYEQLKSLTKGKELTLEALREFISSLDLPTEAKSKLLMLEPRHYIGLAESLAKGREKTHGKKKKKGK